MDGKNSLEVRCERDLQLAFAEADKMVMKKYMNGISKCEVKPIDSALANTDLNSVFRLYRIDKLVYNADENNLEKLMNVYNAVGMCGGSIVNIIVSDGDTVEYYLGTRASDINGVAVCQDMLSSSLLGNFQGSAMTLQKKGGMQSCVDSIWGVDDSKCVTVVSGIPGYRNEDNKENEKYVQGIEKVIDSMKGKPFALVTISAPLSPEQISSIKNGYENLYTQISPFATTQLSYNESDSNAVAETITDGITKTVGQSLTNTISNSTTTTDGTSSTRTHSVSANIGGLAGPVLIGGGYSQSVASGTNHSTGVQNGTSSADARNTSDAKSHSVGKTDTYTNTTGRTLQINIENKAVKNLMDRIEEMIERIDDSCDLGLWNTATYCIADNSQTSQVLASSIEAICRGDKASVESFSVETWTDARKSSRVKDYLKKLVHPILLVDGNNGEFEVNPASLISGKELVIEASLPQKSVPGVPVSEMVAFSRNVVNELPSEETSIKLGNIYHMGCAEKAEVDLDIESLSAHTFITGSTGAGKSNTVYHLLNELMSQKINFMVVEPAKGEYKNVFGNRNDVSVFGTNEKYAELLRINPFMFPKSIHVLEHIDRLIEIFNVCWPMYAAMPAVLKDAVLSAYESCGWILDSSENIYGTDIYPSFKDLQRELVSVIEKSAYSDEVKGNYIGSLATRVKSLTNGINGKIFTDKAIDYQSLFDSNVIIDLSRVGSSETKSLIMGLLVMSLNEYRMDQANTRMNQQLKHVTVLEEAHNLLKNVSGSTSGSEEGGNMAGKSVEMLSNSIAEMRTYGEGFIIVDQSPSAVDISAIRNTNTKIIMRLPEDSDRKQAGKSAALKDEQIDELAKLHRGVAVVYQNNWLDPVLCQISKADVREDVYTYTTNQQITSKQDYSELLKMLMKNRVDEKLDLDVSRVEKQIEDANLSTKTKILLKETLSDLSKGRNPLLLKENAFRKLSDVVCELLDCDKKFSKYDDFGDDYELLQDELHRDISRCADNVTKELELAISQCIIRQMVEQNSSKVEFYQSWREFAVEQRKLV